MTTTDSAARRPRRVFFLGVATLVVAADVIIKQVAATVWADSPVSLLGGWVRLAESRNPGAAFGVGTSATPAISLLAAAVVLGILAFSSHYRTRGTALVMGLALGGAAGNLVDRLFRPPGPMRGHVVDWIDIGVWPSFNLADSSLVVAFALAVLASLSDKDADDDTEATAPCLAWHVRPPHRRPLKAAQRWWVEQGSPPICSHRAPRGPASTTGDRIGIWR